VTDIRAQDDPATGQSVIRAGTHLGTDTTVFGRVTPLAGLLLTPAERLRVGLVYRHRSFVDDWGNTRISGVPGLGNLGYSHHYAHYYEPWQVTLAVSVDLGLGLDASADLTFNRWSSGISTNWNQWGEGHWGDTWTPAAGLRWRVNRPFTVMAGYRFVPSPLDNFGGSNNLLDNDKHIASTGMEFHLGSLFSVPEMNLSLISAMQYAVLVERTEQKDFRRFPSDEAWMTNPGYPAYVYGGHWVAGSVGLEARW
jgi:long-subunit fatty acid transport protein